LVELTTEQAVTLVGLSLGATGAAVQLIAAERLGELDRETVELGQVAVPVALTGAAALGSAMLIPREPKR